MAVTVMRNFGMTLISLAYRLVVRWIVYGSCRVEIRGEGLAALEQRLHGDQPLIITFWHYGVLIVPCLHRRFPLVAMVSASRDGGYIARILEGFGIMVVRGSRNRLGASALKQLIGAMQTGRSAALVADGSQGPARRAQPGAILLASRSGVPVFPLTWAANRYWTFRSWDRTILPKPFARLTVLIGPPLFVPTDLDRTGRDQYRLRLEEGLNCIYRQAWSFYGRQAHADGER